MLGQEENKARAETRDVEQQLLRDWLSTNEDVTGAEGTIRYRHLEGEQHVHTRYSDGHATIEEMAQQALKAGHKHLTISDHSHMLTPEKIARQHAEIDALNEKYRGRLRIVKGVEANVTEDGTLDLSDDQLQQFEHVNVGLHSLG